MLTVKKFAIARAPYRISLGGGGTDLPFYASKKGGALISAAIDEYITVMVAKRSLDKNLFLQYSQTEMVSSLENIQHELLKEVLKYFKIKDSFQIATFSTMPTFTGLGASSVLIVAIVKAMHDLLGRRKTKISIAREAFMIEREILGLAGGYQDQYITSLGGLQFIQVNQKLEVSTEKVVLSDLALKRLKESLVLIYSGIERDSTKVIKSQEKAVDIVPMYDEIKRIGQKSIDLIKTGKMKSLGKAMDDHWQIKRQMTPQISNSKIDEMYLTLKSFGALGGKIMGAGGGGFFLMVVPEKTQAFKRKVKDNNFKIVNFDFDFKGVHKVV